MTTILKNLSLSLKYFSNNLFSFLFCSVSYFGAINTCLLGLSSVQRHSIYYEEFPVASYPGLSNFKGSRPWYVQDIVQVLGSAI